MYKCIIIDDEPHAIEGLSGYLATIPNIELVKSFTEPLRVLKEIDSLGHIDLIFLDVDMPLISGIELAKEIRSKTNKLIFTTAHTKYAFEAFEADADAYLLKPYTLGKFVITLHKLLPMLNETKKKVALTLSEDFFFVKSKEDNLKLVRINFDEVIAVESKQNYVLIYTASKNIWTYLSLTEMIKILAGRKEFMQVHRSFIINPAKIDSIDGNLIKLCNELAITVGDQYRPMFNSFLKERLVKVGKVF
ncbi:MAG: response regulator transcription factor [Flavobacterium sp.]|nr:MAG: response regulator transcription factor [Flavobacterium sp.]